MQLIRSSREFGHQSGESQIGSQTKADGPLGSSREAREPGAPNRIVAGGLGRPNLIVRGGPQCHRLWLLTVMLLLAPFISARAQQLDAYGGTTAVKCPAGAQANFYTAKINNRWWLCTPAGNGFFMKGVYYVDFNDSTPDYQGVVLTSVVAQKYASGTTTDSTLNWALQSVRRLQSWGFNTLNEYSNAYTWPTTTDSQWTTPDHAIPQRMPFVVIVRPSWYAYTNANNWANAPIKDLVPGITAAAYSGYRSHMPDIWDPNFALWLQNALKNDPSVHPAFTAAHNDYLVGFDIDESDNMEGFGAGPDFPTVDVSFSGVLQSGHTHPHIAWFVLATAPTQSSNSNFGVTYSNTTVYTKQALSVWLAARYGNSISALNTAWGSKYTSFGSAGGFGKGTGLLDEDGTCPSRGGSSCWTGDPFTLAGETTAMQQDMSAFLSVYVNQYYSVIKTAFTTQAPGHLLFGISPIGGWGSPPRKEILQVASKYLDAFTLGTIPPFICANCTDTQQRIDFVAQYGGDKPWLNWEGFTAQADSYWSQAAIPSDYVTTQAQRGQLYEQMLDQLIASKDSNGTYHMIGSEWWAFYDSRGERTNWGLLTRKDTPYEDFVSAVRKANLEAVPGSDVDPHAGQ